jgi:hypothetical protein
MTLISKIYGTLLSNKISLPKYIGIALLSELLPALFLITIVFGCIELFDLKYTPPTDYDFSWATFWKVVVFAPIIETYLLIFTLFVLRSCNLKNLKLVIIAALLWGFVHGLQSWPRFFAPAWSFFIYATAYETWRLSSFKKAYSAAAVTHALHNSLIMLASGLDS